MKICLKTVLGNVSLNEFGNVFWKNFENIFSEIFLEEHWKYFLKNVFGRTLKMFSHKLFLAE